MTSNICALIPARYGSSRLPGKPLLQINGKTVIQRTYEQTKKSKYITKIYIVTDDDRIVEECKKFGGDTILVIDECLNGTERISKALNYMVNNSNNTEYDIIVNVQGDEPFINPDHIDFAIEKYQASMEDNNMVCTTIHYKISNHNELYNRSIGKMVTDKNDNIMYCSRAMIPHNKLGTHDEFDISSPIMTSYNGHIGLFIFRKSYLPKFLTDENTSAQLSEDIEWLKIIEHGYKIKSYEVDSYEIGINTKEDYEYLLKKYS